MARFDGVTVRTLSLDDKWSFGLLQNKQMLPPSILLKIAPRLGMVLIEVGTVPFEFWSVNDLATLGDRMRFLGSCTSEIMVVLWVLGD